MNKVTKTISVSSGKGGVGKSTLAANLAYQLAQDDQRVLILDGDLGMANLDIIFNRKSSHTLYDVIYGEMQIEDVLHSIHPNIYLIPAASGLSEMLNLKDDHKRLLLEEVSSLQNMFDVMLIDTAPGIDNNVLYLNSAVHKVMVVMTPDPASLTDAYALIKVLNRNHKVDQFSIVCNQVRDEKEGIEMYRRLSDVASRFLFVSLDYWGSIPQDPIFALNTRRQDLILRQAPEAKASQAIRQVCENMNHFNNLSHSSGGLQFFWQQLLGVAS